jgi:hypothetical protein
MRAGIVPCGSFDVLFPSLESPMAKLSETIDKIGRFDERGVCSIILLIGFVTEGMAIGTIVLTGEKAVALHSSPTTKDEIQAIAFILVLVLTTAYLVSVDWSDDREFSYYLVS